MKKVITVMGVDPSLTATSICIREVGTIKPVKHFNVPFYKKDTDLLGRIKQIKTISAIFFENLKRYEPKIIFVENFSYASRNSLPLQGMVMGGILIMLEEYMRRDGIVSMFPSPQSVKKLISKGGAKKDLLLKEVYKRFKLDLYDDNMADSFLLSEMARIEFLLRKEFGNLKEKLIVDRKRVEKFFLSIKKDYGILKSDVEAVLKVEKIDKLIKVK